MSEQKLKFPFCSSEQFNAEFLGVLNRSVLAQRTYMAYASDWRQFTNWCGANSLEPLPALSETLRLYIADRLREGRKLSTLVRHTSSIAYAHRTAGFPSPCTPGIYELIEGASRLLRQRPKQKRPITLEQLRFYCQSGAGSSVRALRNRAMLLFGFTTALRRSNIVAIDLDDIEFTDRGVVVQVRHEKQDQKGKGREVGIPFGKHPESCPVKALESWIDVRGLWPGPLFTMVWPHKGPVNVRLNPDRVSKIVKLAVASMGCDERLYGAHSLRAGFVTEAAEAGVNEFMIAAQTGHRSLVTLRRYFRLSDPFRGNACSALDL